MTGIKKKNKVQVVYLLILLLMLPAAGSVNAAGTPAGTDISNIAVVNYEFNSTPQQETRSQVNTFLVDRKLDVNVSEVSSGPASVEPGDTAADCNALGFNVTNEGNDTQDFTLSAVNQAGGSDPFGNTDNFDVTNLTVVVDDGDGICDTDDTADFIDDLAPDASAFVWVLGDIDSGRVDGDIAAVTLTAQVAKSNGTPGADITADDSGNPDTGNGIEDVFTDGHGDTDINNDGRYSDTDSFKVAEVIVSVIKSASTLLDPDEGSEAATGDVITYTLEIRVTGSGTALNVVITDPVPEYTTYKSGSLTLNAGGLTDADDADAGDVGKTTLDTVTVDLGDLASASPAQIITFEVTVN